MTSDSPPNWMQKALRAVLRARNRETVAGDLLEEYRGEWLPRWTRNRANRWYLRQVISLAMVRVFGSSTARNMLLLTSIFVSAAGVWLAVMENVLRHSGYETRLLVDSCIALQGLCTLSYVLLGGTVAFRYGILVSAIAGALFGVRAVVNVSRAEHFEGFVLVIGLGLIGHGLLSLGALVNVPHRAA